MFSHDKPQFRPQKSLVNIIADKWLTPSGFAWFLAFMLAFLMLTLAVKGAQKLSSNSYQLTAMNAVTLDMTLRDMDSNGALVYLFDADCGSDCEKQLDSFLNLRSQQESGEISLFFIAMDDKPEDSIAFLSKMNFPDSLTVYYAAPDEHQRIASTLERIGSTGVPLKYPHSFVIGKNRKFISEYKGYIRAQEVVRTLRMFKIRMPR
jgi:hypothetical protein